MVVRRIAPALVLGLAILATGPPGRASTPTVTVVVDVAAGHKSISPLVYGWNGDAALGGAVDAHGGFAAVLAATRPGLVRLGGNRWTAFNWENNDSNAGSDYLYENDDYLSSSTTPGAAVLSTVKAVKNAGATTLVTVPISTYVAADRNGPVTVGSTVDTTRFKQNKPTGPLTTTPSTSDAFVYQNQFVDWLTHAAPGAKLMYSLDNEPNDWYSTHQEVHPAHPTYAELVGDNLTFARMIKHTYSTLGLSPPLVAGPVLDGWQGQEDPDNNDGSSADFATHGRFVDYYLDQLHAADTAAGKRLIDVLDLHWYPQVAPDVYNVGHSPDVVAAREQATRSLWDPTYTENSWVAQYIGGPIKLIPRLRSEIAAHDPGLGLAISEWNYGGGEDVSGGIAVADALGIFGRYGLTAATYWPQFSPQEDWTFGAFELFRNYDGSGSRFGDTEVSATDSDTVNTSAYASIDKANANRAVVVLVNKRNTATTATLRLQNYASTGHAAVYTLTSTSPDPRHVASITATAADTFTYAMPAQSVSLIVPKPAPAAPAFYADSPPPATQSIHYAYTFGATGTPAPTYALASGSLPAGLTLHASTGALSGTPTTLGTFSFTIRASNTAGSTVTPTLSVTTSAGQSPHFTAASPPAGAWETAYSYAFAASGTPAPTFAVASGSLPAGLALDQATGALTGTPTAVGSSSFTIRASNGVAPAAVTPTLTVKVGKPADGTVLSWGDDGDAQLGPGERTTTAVAAPVTLPGGATAVQVAAGNAHALALTAGGAVYAWGKNDCGQLGNGVDSGCNDPLPTRTPVRVQFPSGTPAVVQVAAGADDSLALTADGNVWAWGDNGVGELGDGTNGDWRNKPVKTHLGAYAGTIVAVEADGYSSLALTADGHVLAWGSGDGGALGNGSTGEVDTPAPAALGSDRVAALAAGGTQAGHVVALTRTGSLVAWGNNAEGQLGDGTTTDRSTPVSVHGSLANIVDVGSGSYHSFALTAAGAAYAWGNDGYGELGDRNSSTVAKTPVAVAPPLGRSTLPVLEALLGGDFYSLALSKAGVAFATGLNDAGQLGTGQDGGSVGLTTVALPTGTTLASLSATMAFGLAIVGAPAPAVVALGTHGGPAAGGTQVVVAGRGFAHASTVRFGATAATAVTFLSARELLATAPAHAAGAVHVTVDGSPARPGGVYTYG